MCKSPDSRGLRQAVQSAPHRPQSSLSAFGRLLFSQLEGMGFNEQTKFCSKAIELCNNTSKFFIFTPLNFYNKVFHLSLSLRVLSTSIPHFACLFFISYSGLTTWHTTKSISRNGCLVDSFHGAPVPSWKSLGSQVPHCRCISAVSSCTDQANAHLSFIIFFTCTKSAQKHFSWLVSFEWDDDEVRYK